MVNSREMPHLIPRRRRPPNSSSRRGQSKQRNTARRGIEKQRKSGTSIPPLSLLPFHLQGVSMGPKSSPNGAIRGSGSAGALSILFPFYSNNAARGEERGGERIRLMIWVGLLKRRRRASPAYSDDAMKRANVRQEHGGKESKDAILLIPRFLEVGA
jgi:hypothetical protein